MSHVYGSPIDVNEIRSACFTRASEWTPPTADELRIMLNALNLSQVGFSRMIGVSDRAIRRWVDGEKPIGYSAWCILAEEAGIRGIWK